jgi:transposase
MANPYPVALREHAVHTYEDGLGTYAEVAEEFGLGVATLERWVRRGRETGSVAPLAKGGGWRSPVDLPVLHALVGERPDTTTGELTRAYNRRVGRAARVHRSSVLRALQRSGYVFKKNDPGQPNSIVRASRPNGAPFAAGSGA